MRSFTLGLIAGGIVIYLGVKTMPLNGVAYLAAASVAGGGIAGVAAGSRGVVAGFAAAVLAAALWAADVIVREWASGGLARQVPDCDPCGLSGVLVRMIIVSAMGLATFGVAAAVAGALAGYVRRRAAAR